MPDGYMGRLLVADLTSRKSWIVPLPQGLKDDFVGGKGFGAKLIYDLTPAGVDPLGPENVIMFMTGPLTATAAPSMRACVITKSPLTGIYLDSFFGGRFGPEIKYAGYDGLIILGRAEQPTYLWICDDRVEFRSAKGIWGSDALAANALVKKDLDAPEAQVVTIGQAGENLVKYAAVVSDRRTAGRAGTGAVMGSKNLKACWVSLLNPTYDFCLSPQPSPLYSLPYLFLKLRSAMPWVDYILKPQPSQVNSFLCR